LDRVGFLLEQDSQTGIRDDVWIV